MEKNKNKNKTQIIVARGWKLPLDILPKYNNFYVVFLNLLPIQTLKNLCLNLKLTSCLVFLLNSLWKFTLGKVITNL